MKKLFTILMTLLVSFTYAQDNVADKLKKFYNEQKYNEIIKYKSDEKELSAKALYYVGMAYYMKQEDENAMKFIDKAMEKGPIDHDMYFYKAQLLTFSKKYIEALPYFDKAIAILPDEPDFFVGKGQCFNFMGEKDSAIVYYEKAVKSPYKNIDMVIMLAEAYQVSNQLENAIKTYKLALNSMKTNNKPHQATSINVALMDYVIGDYVDAKEILEKHLSIYPNDDMAIEKIIQVYYALNEYDKVIPHKQKLLQLHNANQTQENIKGMYCMDNFMWNGKRVSAYEVFGRPTAEDLLFEKINFFVVDENQMPIMRVVFEASIGTKIKGDKYYYVLALKKQNASQTYWNWKFDEVYNYIELKQAVLDILNEKVKPGSASVIYKKE